MRACPSPSGSRYTAPEGRAALQTAAARIFLCVFTVKARSKIDLMNILTKVFGIAAMCCAIPTLAQGIAGDPAYTKQVLDWRVKAEDGLRRDNGWLTLAGRYPLKPGENTFGTAKTNDIVFPPGLGPN